MDRINKCGIADKGAVSMQQVLGHAPDFDEVTRRFAHHFARVYRRSLEFAADFARLVRV